MLRVELKATIQEIGKAIWSLQQEVRMEMVINSAFSGAQDVEKSEKDTRNDGVVMVTVRFYDVHTRICDTPSFPVTQTS